MVTRHLEFALSANGRKDDLWANAVSVANGLVSGNVPVDALIGLIVVIVHTVMILRAAGIIGR